MLLTAGQISLWGILQFVAPMAAVFLGYIILNESFVAKDFVGLDVVPAGVFLAGAGE